MIPEVSKNDALSEKEGVVRLMQGHRAELKRMNGNDDVSKKIRELHRNSIQALARRLEVLKEIIAAHNENDKTIFIP